MKIGLEPLVTLREFSLAGEFSIFDSYGLGADGRKRRFSRQIRDLERQFDSTVMLDGALVIGAGEDPRAFAFEDSVAAYSVAFRPGHGWINRIYLTSEARWYYIWIPENLAPGKNWTPFVRDGVLHVIHEFAPFRVLRVDTSSRKDCFWRATLVEEWEVPAAPSPVDQYCRLRGGSNGLAFGDAIVGFGHTNDLNERKVIVHRPFFWEYRPGSCPRYVPLDSVWDENYCIVDPTSLYRDRDDLILITCETELPWMHSAQRGRTCAYRVRLGSSHNHHW